MKKIHVLYATVIALLLAVIFIIIFAFGAGAASQKELDRFDVDRDGKVNISDVTYLLSYLGGNIHVPKEDGLYAEDGGIRYYQNDQAVTGFYTVSGKKLYFDPETGLMQSGAISVDGFDYAAPVAFTFGGFTLYAYGNPIVEDGLAFELNEDGNSYTVKGIGTVTGSSVVIPETYEGKPVTAIGNKAFADQTQVTAILIPESVTTIGTRAFYNTGITEITIPESVTSIGTQIFYKANNLKTVHYNACYLPTNSTENPLLSLSGIETVELGQNAVRSGVLNLGIVNKKIVLADDVTSIGLVFKGTAIKDITLGSGITAISRDNFENSTGLISVTIPASVTTIGDYAFRGCTGLTSVTIPDNLTSVGRYAFSGCTGLTSVTIPGSVTSIANSVFSGCTSLVSVLIPDSVTSIGGGAFSGCKSLTSITIPDSVTTISGSAFSGCTGLTSVTIPDSVTVIDENAFSNCTGLLSATIPDSVSMICEGAFSGCTSLTSVTIPDSVTSIGGSAFSGCTGLTSVTIPDSVTSIGERAFFNCTSLQSVTIPDSVTSISEYAFSGCTSLRSVTIPDSVTAIGYQVFQGCASLQLIYNYSDLQLTFGSTDNGYLAYYAKVIVDPNGNKTYKSSDMILTDDFFIFERYGETLRLTGYYGNEREITLPLNYNGEPYELYQFRCGSHVTIPEGATTIGGSAFEGCTGLTSVTIPDSVTSIGGHAFSYCTGLTSVTIPGSVTSIGEWAFYGCTGLTSVTILEGVTSIGDYMFYNCTGLQSVTIPESVRSIGNFTFEGCTSLQSVTIPEGVTSIGYGAFYGCTSLTTVYYRGSAEQWKAITIESGNAPLTNAKKIYNYTGD